MPMMTEAAELSAEDLLAELGQWKSQLRMKASWGEHRYLSRWYDGTSGDEGRLFVDSRGRWRYPATLEEELRLRALQSLASKAGGTGLYNELQSDPENPGCCRLVTPVNQRPNESFPLVLQIETRRN